MKGPRLRTSLNTRVMQKLNKYGLQVKRVVSKELNIGDTVVGGDDKEPIVLTPEEFELLRGVVDKISTLHKNATDKGFKGSEEEYLEQIITEGATISGNNTFTGSNVFNGTFLVKNNPAISHFVDITNYKGDKETHIKAAPAWFGEEMTLKVDNISGLQRAGQFFLNMSNIFGPSNTLKKIYAYSDGNIFYNWLFADAKSACPNVKTMIYRAENAPDWANDDWNFYQLNVDYLEYYAPKRAFTGRGFSYNNEKAKSIKIDVKTGYFEGCYALSGNVVREIRTHSPQTNAINIFYSKDSTLKIATIQEGFWDTITTAKCAYYGAKNLLHISMYPSSLPALQNAPNMFAGCELPADYVITLLNSLPQYSDDSTHELGLGIHIDHQYNEELLNVISETENKGWIINVQWNGTATETTNETYSLRGPSIFAKERYIEQPDGTVEKTIDWYHYSSNPEDYQEFSSLEEANNHFGIIERLEEN